MKSTKNMNPALHAKILEDTNERYNLVESKVLGSTRKAWEEAEKHIVHQLGYNYKQYQKWCLENLKHEDFNEDFQ